MFVRVAGRLDAEMAVRLLKRRMVQEGIIRQARLVEHHETPSEQRVRVSKETETRLFKKAIKERLKGVLAKKRRCVATAPLLPPSPSSSLAFQQCCCCDAHSFRFVGGSEHAWDLLFCESYQ